MEREKLQQNIKHLSQRIEKAAKKSGRSREDIALIAVSKNIDVQTAAIAADLGIKDFGENRVQELKVKADALPGVRWHMIGRLQTNKVKDVVGRTVLIHSLDRWRLAEALNKRAAFAGIEVPALLQVNIAGEEQKAGLDPADVKSFLESVGQLENLRIYGLMTIAPYTEVPEETRPVFRQLWELRETLRIRDYANVELRYLSMGMSNDFEIAIEEGANLVRVGTALFK
ncbi:MAG TPA: YggS family pyridoxal phosphate-dependent enzyme [Syntrophomonadaceae bacterium]|jgi:pyridoxal phosphate enzyme (YggS family)|nr:YggS family pyridoxal phosphate-dependent enzyme [Syntrophomonadaceae bacterium]